jgi:hypothetical protein
VWGEFGGPSRADDIFYAVHNDSGFGPAIRCDSTVNTPYWDSDPSCPADGSLLYFESRRESQGGGAAHLFVAGRVLSASPRRRANHHPPAMIVVPTLGSSNTPVTITLPANFGTKSVCIFNLCGQQIFSFPVHDVTQTQFIWKGISNGTHFISAGTYFVFATGFRDQATAKIVLLR